MVGWGEANQGSHWGVGETSPKRVKKVFPEKKAISNIDLI